jgi:cell division protease FtsH
VRIKTLPSSKKNILIIIISIILLYILSGYAVFRDRTHVATPLQLYTAIDNKQVHSLYEDNTFYYFILDHKNYKLAKAMIDITLLENIVVQNKPDYKFYYLFALGMTVLGFFIWLTQQQFNANQSQKKHLKRRSTDKIKEEQPSTQPLPVTSMVSHVRFEDVAGIAEVKIELEEIIDFLRDPKKYKDFGVHMPKGVLLVGPPGVGKTLIAKAVAGEADVPFFYQSGSSFVQIYVGMGAKRVQELFAKAKQNAPSIVFIDEIDSVGKARGENRNDEREATLNQLLTEMDGFEGATGVIVIAATNKIEMLDSALLRAGRFDRRIFVELPNLEERALILDKYLKAIAHNVNTHELARMSVGFNGASLEAFVNEAALYALRLGDTIVENRHFLEVKDKVQLGKKRSLTLSDEEKQIQSYYQAAKAMTAFGNDLPFDKFTLLSGGLKLPSKEILSSSELNAQLKVYLAGMAMSEIIYQEFYTNSKQDLKDAKTLVDSMVNDYYMGDNFIAHKYDEEKILESTYKEVKKFLIEMRPVIERLSKRLAKTEKITKEDILKEVHEVF